MHFTNTLKQRSLKVYVDLAFSVLQLSTDRPEKLKSRELVVEAMHLKISTDFGDILNCAKSYAELLCTIFCRSRKACGGNGKDFIEVKALSTRDKLLYPLARCRATGRAITALN